MCKFTLILIVLFSFIIGCGKTDTTKTTDKSNDKTTKTPLGQSNVKDDAKGCC